MEQIDPYPGGMERTSLLCYMSLQKCYLDSLLIPSLSCGELGKLVEQIDPIPWRSGTYLTIVLYVFTEVYPSSLPGLPTDTSS